MAALRSVGLLLPAKLRRIMAFDAKGMVSLALLVARRRHGVPPGAVGVTYSGAQLALQAGFLFAMVVEIVGVELLLRAIDAPEGLRAAFLVIDLYSILVVPAVIAACVTRPPVLSDEELRVRYGAFFDLRIPRTQISSLRIVRNYNESGMVKVLDDRLAVAVASQTNVVVPIPGSRLTAEVGRVRRADRDEPGLGQHPLRRGIVAGGGRTQRAQPVPRHRQPAQFPDGRGRHATSGDVLRDPVTEFSSAVPEAVQVEPAQNRAILGDEHVEGALSGLLLSQQGAVQFGELVEELVTAVGDRGGEVGAVHQLEGQDRRGMAGMQPLQLGHRPTLPGRCVEATWVSAGGGQPQGVRAGTALGRLADMTEKITRINPEQLHETPGYHHVTVVEAGRTAYLAGQCPLDRNGDLVGAGSLETQVDQVVANALTALAAAGARPPHVVRSVIYVRSDEREHLAAAWRRLTESALGAAFTTASTLLGVAQLGFPGQLVEVDLTVALPD